MSNERSDEFFSWRSRLGSPDALPEQGLDDREQTWEKLARRLHGKKDATGLVRPTTGFTTPTADFAMPAIDFTMPAADFAMTAADRANITRRRSSRYSIAAACLLLALVAATRLFHHPGTHPPVPASIPPSPVAAAAARLEEPPILRSGPGPKDLARSVTAYPPAAYLPASPPTPAYPLASHLPASFPPTGHPSTTPTGHPSSVPSADTSLFSPLPSTAPLAAIAAPDSSAIQKNLKAKQLRVVHINEIDPVSQPQPAMTSIRDGSPEIRLVFPFKNH